jgi:RNA polymerase sigma factor (sigma-70 family)
VINSADEFTELTTAAGPRILAYLIRRVDCREDAADLLAEVFAVVWKRRADVPADEPMRTGWIFGVARGVLANHHRSSRRRYALADKLRRQLASDEGAAPSEHLEAVRSALATLDPADRDLLLLVAWDGLTAVEIAAMHDLAPATVRQRISRARRRLRGLLADFGTQDDGSMALSG